MSGMTMVVNALQVRFGSMDPEAGKEGFDWANMHVIEDELQIDQGFAGVNIGKLPLDTANGNRLAKDLHSAAQKGGVLPGFIEVTFAPQLSMKGTKMIVVGWKPVSQSAATQPKAS